MLFSSIPFLYYFLPAVLLLYFLLPWLLKYTLAPLIPGVTAKLTGGRWQATAPGFLTSVRNLILLVFSLVFYGWGFHHPPVLRLRSCHRFLQKNRLEAVLDDFVCGGQPCAAGYF